MFRRAVPRAMGALPRRPTLGSLLFLGADHMAQTSKERAVVRTQFVRDVACSIDIPFEIFVTALFTSFYAVNVRRDFPS